MWNEYESDDKILVILVRILIFLMWCLINRDECKKWNVFVDYWFLKIKNVMEFVLNKCVNNNDLVL